MMNICMMSSIPGAAAGNALYERQPVPVINYSSREPAARERTVSQLHFHISLHSLRCVEAHHDTHGGVAQARLGRLCLAASLAQLGPATSAGSAGWLCQPGQLDLDQLAGLGLPLSWLGSSWAGLSGKLK